MKVQVNREGEFLRPMESKTTIIEKDYIIHDICMGFVDRHEFTIEFSVLSCRACNLRLHMPKEIKTWQEMKEYFERKIINGR